MMAKRYVLTSNTSPDDWYLRADPHRTVRRRISDFAERFGRLIECQAGWEASSRLGGGRGWGNTRAQPRDPLRTRCPRRHRQLARLRVNTSFLNTPRRSPLGPQVRQVSATASRGLTRPAYLLRLLCPWVMRGDYPLGALKRRWLRSGVIRSPLRPDCPTGFGGGIPSPNLHPCAVYLSLASELEVDGQGPEDPGVDASV